MQISPPLMRYGCLPRLSIPGRGEQALMRDFAPFVCVLAIGCSDWFVRMSHHEQYVSLRWADHCYIYQGTC